MLWTCSSSAFFQLLHASQIQVFYCRCGLQPRQPLFSTYYRSWKGIVYTQRLWASMSLCITCGWNTLQEFIQIAPNMFWMAMKCVQVIVPIKAHVIYMWENFMEGPGGGGGRAVQWWIMRVWNTCYILPLQTLITVFISFLCNPFSFMVELTQVSRVQWFNTHVSFTCLVKCSKAPHFQRCQSLWHPFL